MTAKEELFPAEAARNPAGSTWIWKPDPGSLGVHGSCSTPGDNGASPNTPLGVFSHNHRERREKHTKRKQLFAAPRRPPPGWTRDSPMHRPLRASKGGRTEGCWEGNRRASSTQREWGNPRILVTSSRETPPRWRHLHENPQAHETFAMTQNKEEAHKNEQPRAEPRMVKFCPAARAATSGASDRAEK